MRIWGINKNLILSKSELLFFYRCVFLSEANFFSLEKIKSYLIKDKNNDGLQILNNIDNIKKCYDILSDDKSKKIYLRLIAKKLVWCVNCNDIFCEHQYFDSEVYNLTDSEFYVDAGSYDGDTIREFIKSVSDYSSVYAIEPYTVEYNKLLNATKKFKNINCINVGLGDANGFQFFQAAKNGSSKYIENGEYKCPIITGDSLKIAPTLIKMDIEGSELDALKGFKETIKTYHPKLAVCIYHKIEDFWEIPLYIYNNFHYNSFYIRHYSNNF